MLVFVFFVPQVVYSTTGKAGTTEVVKVTNGAHNSKEDKDDDDDDEEEEEEDFDIDAI